MADEKQIIVDGIDVSKCKHHRKCILPDNIGCEIDDFLCCDKPNCDYKQLVRKTQECEQKEKELLSNERIINKLMKEVDELKQECEEYIKNYDELDVFEDIKDPIDKAKGEK